MRIIYLPKRALCKAALLILAVFVAWKVLPGALSAGWRSFQALYRPTLESRAKEIAVAIEDYDYRDQKGWSVSSGSTHPLPLALHSSSPSSQPRILRSLSRWSLILRLRSGEVR